MTELLQLEHTHDGHVARVWLNRPEVHNALDRALIEDLTALVHRLEEKSPVRAIVIGGRGKSLCAGADLGDMKASSNATSKENLADAQRIARLFRTIAESPLPVLTRVHGNVFGGGVGLVAASDLAVGTTDARFAISETRLGIIPGIISPYLLRRMGDGRARPYMLTGRRFDGTAAHALGLLQEAVEPEALDAAVDRWVADLLQAGPRAQAKVKEILSLNAERPFGEVVERVPHELAEVRSGEEAKEGFRAFFEKRKPSWAVAAEKIRGGGR